MFRWQEPKKSVQNPKRKVKKNVVPRSYKVTSSSSANQWVEKSAPTEDELELRDQKHELKEIIETLQSLMKLQQPPSDEQIKQFADLSYRANFLCKQLDRKLWSYGTTFRQFVEKFCSDDLSYWKFWIHDRTFNKMKHQYKIGSIPGTRFCRCAGCNGTFLVENYEEKLSKYQQSGHCCSTFFKKFDVEFLATMMKDVKGFFRREQVVNDEVVSVPVYTTEKEIDNVKKILQMYIDNAEDGEVEVFVGESDSSLFSGYMGLYLGKPQFDPMQSVCDWCISEMLKGETLIGLLIGVSPD